MQQAIQDYSVTLGTHHHVIYNYPMEADYSVTLGAHHRVICNYPMESVCFLISTSCGYYTEENRFYYTHMGSHCVSTAEYEKRVLDQIKMFFQHQDGHDYH